MPLIKKVRNRPGWLIFWCLGCERHHYVDEGWAYNDDATNPTLSPSVLVRYGDQPDADRCHLFVRDGQIRYLSDCTHKLAGQTVTMADLDDVRRLRE